MKGKKELGAVRIGVGKKEDTLVLCSLCLQYFVMKGKERHSSEGDGDRGTILTLLISTPPPTCSLNHVTFYQA